ncbi:hypothetical protein TrVE_jg5575 [Triparma verrucosa]|uniref:Uncharacterized protein n=1 Tax=Triparma verrucosa TaxID=1606542 RepID=A0A9W7ENC4_9STRA|nr:hypothetical protein TrVE_jg5575 [Triparma verrucosa]
MSNMTSELGSNAIEVPNLNNLEVVDNEEEVFEGSESDSAAVDTAAIGVEIRWLDRKWHKVVEKKLNELEDEPYGEIIVHGGNDISGDEAYSDAREKNMKQVANIVFLLNFTVGDFACIGASILIAVDIPEGISIIGTSSFAGCSSLTEMKFPKSLTKIVPSDIDIDYGHNVHKVVAYLRSIQ